MLAHFLDNVWVEQNSFLYKREKLELYLFEVMIDAYVFKFNIFYKFKRIISGKLQFSKIYEKYA